MVWQQLLLIAALIPAPLAAADSDCSQTAITSGICSVGGSIQGDEAVLEGNATVPGGGGGSGGGGGASGAAPEEDPCDAIVAGRCYNRGQRTRPGDPVAPVTLRDIAAFRPQPGVQYMQPDGWTVIGLHTNFYAVRPVQVVHGTLLGQPASVRFTPVAYHWDYGDGHRATRGTPGAPWATLGVREFGATPTSHVYDAAGAYTIRLTIDFRAEYRFAGGGWTPIAGRLSLPANELRITSGTAKTVLVERDCVADPSGPGC